MKIIKDFASFLTESTLEINQDNVDKAMSSFSNNLAGYLGKKEEGENSGPMVTDFLSRVGLGPGNPWCQAYVYSMFDNLTRDLGISNPLPKTAGVLDHWGKADSENKVNADPALVKPGMIFIKTREGASSGKGHTGIVTAVDGEKFTSVDGNSSDGVKANRYNIGDMVGFIDYFKGIRTPEFESKLDAALSNLASKAGSIVIKNPGAIKSGGTLIDSNLISKLIKKLKEKNFGQDDLKKYSGTSNPSGKGATFKASSGGFPPENMKAIERALDDHGVTNEFARKALLGVCSKEDSDLSGEESYANTDASRIKAVFGKRFEGWSPEKIDALKKNDDDFFEHVYGMTNSIGKSIGNDQPGDGAKYKGYGFNQITGKGEYKELQKFYNETAPKEVKDRLGSIDIVENPKLLNRPDVAAEFAVLYFLKRFKGKGININDFTGLEPAVRTFTQANAGWGSSLDSGIGAEGYSKALAFAQGLTSTGTGSNIA